FREVLKRLGVGASDSLMIGDWAERDVVGGRGLGMKTVFARYGDTFGTEESGADFDIDDVFELVAIVDRLNEAAGPPGPAANADSPPGAGTATERPRVPSRATDPTRT